MSMNLPIGGRPRMPLAPQLGVPAFGGMPNLGGSINLAPGGPPMALPMGGSAALPVNAAPNFNFKLTEGIPDPNAVQRQKEGYAKALEDQLRKGVEQLAATHKQQTDLLHAQANQEKQRYNLAMDQKVKERELELSQQYNEQLMRLQQAAQVQRADLEQQACGLTLEYQSRKVQEEYMAQQVGIQKQHMEAQKRLSSEIQKFSIGVPGVAPIAPPAQQPLASYALPTPMAGPMPSLPVAAPIGGVLPYVPPALPKVPGSFSAPLGSGRPVNLSYVPPGTAGIPTTVVGQPSRSYVPPTPAPPMIR